MRLEPQATALFAPALRERLLAVLDRLEGARGPAVLLDGGRVECIDITCLQVLAAFALAAARVETGVTIEWRAASDALKRAARLAGLAGVLGLEARPIDPGQAVRHAG